MLSFSVIAVGVLAGVAGLGAGPALGAQVQCGDKIKSDTKLTSDLVNCPNNGIVIGADHVTLDLNGHRIDGNKKLIKHCPQNEICDVGIVDPGRDGITVKG